MYAADSIRQRAARCCWGTLASWASLGLAGRGGNVTLAAFPLADTLTAANLVRHPQHGPLLAELLQLGLVDERSAVILHLAAERRRLRQQPAAGGGASVSDARPWLALLPDSFSTTLFFSELDMQWLRGTTLHTATRLRQKALRDSWAQLEPSAAASGWRAAAASSASAASAAALAPAPAFAAATKASSSSRRAGGSPAASIARSARLTSASTHVS